MATAATISKEMVQDILMLTTMQEGMLFHYWHREQSRFYCEQVGIELVGEVDRYAFETAWQLVAEANELARAVIRWNEQRKAVQIIKREHRIPIAYADLSKLDSVEQSASLLALKKERLADRIDIREAPIRVLLSKLAADRYELLIDYHHIVMDGWSFGILIQEFLANYEALKEGIVPRVKEKPSFRSYLKWTKEQDKPALEAYWKEYLAGYQVRTTIAADRPKLHESAAMSMVSCPLADELHAHMQLVCETYKLSLASLLYTAWGLLLQKYNNTNDVCFGVTVSGRPPEIPGIEQMIGLFIQTVPVRMRSEWNDTPVAYARKVSSSLSNKEVNGGLPLREIMACSELEGGGLPFDSVVVIKNYPFDRKKAAGDGSGGLKLARRHVHEQTNFDLTLQITVDQGIHIDFHFNAELYDLSTIQLVAERYVRTLSAMLDAPLAPIAELDLVTEEEMDAIRRTFHNTEAAFPDCTIPALVWGRAAYHPERLAVVDEQTTLTYGQLMRQARGIAALLQMNGAAPQSRVALFVPRSAAMVASVLGILEAGCICVPLDVNHPAERTLAILEDCEAAMMLVTEEAPQPDLAFNGKVIPIGAGSLPDDQACVGGTKPSDTAYMIYTSGSTGKPKGAMLHHRGIVNHTLAKIKDLRIEEHDVVGNSFSVNVVASIWQMLAPLFVGARLVVYAEEVERDPLEQFRRMEQDGVTVIQVIPSVLNAYVRAIDVGIDAVPLRALKSIALTSEETKPGLVSTFYRLYDHIQLVNCYGQTECCDDTLHYSIPREEIAHSVPIGRPLPNTRPYILDLYGKVQPLGMAGELCVVGAGVSYGYWQRPDLNGNTFIEHPLEPGVTMYRTGDLAKWHADGTIRYMGRLDHQVKIRGNRIELNEVENGLARMAAIRETAVVVRHGPRGEDVLWAFFTASSSLTAASIRSFMSERFPSYMIPEFYTQLEQMPLMPNGKINRHVLRSMEAVPILVGNKTAYAEGQLEQRILDVWQRVLQRDEIGATDSFFDAGGNSLLILELATQLSQALDVQVSVTDLFMHATVRRQAAHLGGLLAGTRQAQSRQASAAQRLVLRSVQLHTSARGSGDPAESAAFGTQVPPQLIASLLATEGVGKLPLSEREGEGMLPEGNGVSPAIGKERTIVVLGELASAALALLLSKYSDNATEMTLYMLDADGSRVMPVDYSFEENMSAAAWLHSQLKRQRSQMKDTSKWAEVGSLISAAEDRSWGARPVVAIQPNSQMRAGHPSYGHHFNLWVDIRESVEGEYMLAWGAPPGQWNREIMKQWVSTHIKLMAYLLDNAAKGDG